MRTGTSLAIAFAVASTAACASSDAERATGEVPVGSILQAFDERGRPVQLRIDAIEPDANDPERELQLYTLSVHDGGRWTNFCAPDAYGAQQAIVLAGSWSARGAYTPSDRVTIACTSGAFGKCVRWGYKPWKKLDGRSLADFHLACVRMTRADYCGDGRAHTVDGTWIDLYDRLGIQTPAPEPGMPSEFEAGWGPDGATYLAVPRWTPDVASIVAECPAKLAGRVAVAGRALTADQVLSRFPETLILNDHAARVEDRKRRPGAFAAPQR